MAIRKIIEVEGKSIIQTSVGNVDSGIQRVSFSAYVKVTDINGNKNKITANVNFKGDVHEFNKQYQILVSVEDGAPNFIAQVYEHLKTLEEFTGAEDC
jgi:hypothetical protein